MKKVEGRRNCIMHTSCFLRAAQMRNVKKAAELAQRLCVCNIQTFPDQRTPGEKMMLSNVRFSVLLVKFFISPPG